MNWPGAPGAATGAGRISRAVAPVETLPGGLELLDALLGMMKEKEKERNPFQFQLARCVGQSAASLLLYSLCFTQDHTSKARLAPSGKRTANRIEGRRRKEIMISPTRHQSGKSLLDKPSQPIGLRRGGIRYLASLGHVPCFARTRGRVTSTRRLKAGSRFYKHLGLLGSITRFARI